MSEGRISVGSGSGSGTDSDIVIHHHHHHHDNGWTAHKEQQLRRWQQFCKIHSYSHALANEHYRKRFFRLTVPNIVLTGVCTVFSGSALLVPDQAFALTLVALISSAIAVGLGSWLQSSNPATVASVHADRSAKYQSLVIDIDAELIKGNAERIQCVDFIHEVQTQMTELATSGSAVPLKIWKDVNSRVARGEFEFSKLEEINPSFLQQTMKIKSNLRRHHTLMASHQHAAAAAAANAATNSAGAGGNVVVDIDMGTPTADTDSVSVAVAESSTDPPQSPVETLPAYELRLNDPAANKIAENLLAFHMNRFG